VRIGGEFCVVETILVLGEEVDVGAVTRDVLEVIGKPLLKVSFEDGEGGGVATEGFGPYELVVVEEAVFELWLEVELRSDEEGCDDGIGHGGK
jgi:hypothetical protein